MPSRLVLVGLFLCLTVTARAGEELPQVAVDWSGVTDATIERCGLVGLEGLLVQQLLEAGYAVVQAVDAEGFAVSIREQGDGLAIEATIASIRAGSNLPTPEPCESTLQLDIGHAVLEALADVRARRPIPVPEVPPPPPEPSPWQLRVGAGVVLPGAPYPLPRLDAELQYSFGSVAFAAGLEGALGYYGGVLLAEPAVSAGLLASADLGSGWTIGAGAQAALLIHMFSSDEDSGSHVDGRLAAQLVASTSIVGVRVMPFVRRLAVQHLFDADVAYESRHWGVLIAVTLRVF